MPFQGQVEYRVQEGMPGTDECRHRLSAQPQFQSAPPARGATPLRLAVPTHDLVFQSAPPARGATPNEVAGGSTGIRFNPRPPRGGRLRAVQPFPTERLSTGPSRT